MELCKILSNLRMPKSWECCGLSGSTIYAQSFSEFISNLHESDLVVVNGLEATLRLCALFRLVPILRRPLVAVDVVLRRPDSPRSLLSVLVTRHLLQRVDYFLHYFRDLGGYQNYFGVTPERSAYVSFKSNVRYRVAIRPNPDGEYVLCIGQSMRDYETFFEAIGTLPYPAAIPVPDFRELRRHRSRFTRSLNELPGNVSVLPDDKSQDSLLRILRGAKLVVLPILKSSLCASGISLYLNSMLLGKCVLISKGPGASDVLTDEAILVNPEDPGALAQAIRRAWEDETLRRKTAASGYAYALSLGGEPELYQRILETAVHWYSHSASHRESMLMTRYS